jgi:hypothetical protein
MNGVARVDGKLASTQAWQGRGKREMKALLVVGLLLGVGFPMNEATGQTAACRKALAVYKSAAEAFLHATVSLGPANLVPTCTALDALLNARKRKDATQKRVRAACPAGTIRTEDTRQWKQFLETEKTRIEECNVGRQRGRNAAAHQATRSRIRPRSALESKMITGSLAVEGEGYTQEDCRGNRANVALGLVLNFF